MYSLLTILFGAALALVAFVDAVATVGRESRHDAEKTTIEALVVNADAVATAVGSEVRHDAEKMQPMIKLSSFMVIMSDRYGDYDED